MPRLSVPVADLRYYATLEISPSATKAEIKKSYRRLALLWHPDRQQSLSEDQSGEKFKKEEYSKLTLECNRDIKSSGPANHQGSSTGRAGQKPSQYSSQPKPEPSRRHGPRDQSKNYQSHRSRQPPSWSKKLPHWDQAKERGFQASMNNFRASMNNFRASMNNFQASVNNFQTSMNNFQAFMRTPQTPRNSVQASMRKAFDGAPSSENGGSFPAASYSSSMPKAKDKTKAKEHGHEVPDEADRTVTVTRVRDMLKVSVGRHDDKKRKRENDGVDEDETVIKRARTELWSDIQRG
ncbi:hypothetical protein B0T21DRAFT_440734 [Apiosordaria backusii]|uniref:J domain-containing protein n=1 Tax=Apiosordaria backusii TaxID=314023 RepID=A0AA40BLF3_9PEZI|nr:hypothetical protein B0T21DRAFT_440734 [Apiosordaria backusii]